MHLCSCGITCLRLSRIVVRIALRKLITRMLLDIIFQIDDSSRLLLEYAAVFTNDADLPEIIARRINEVVCCRHRMRILHRSQFSLRSFG